MATFKKLPNLYNRFKPPDMPKKSRFVLSLQAAAQIWQLLKSCQIYTTALNHPICRKKVDLWAEQV